MKFRVILLMVVVLSAIVHAAPVPLHCWILGQDNGTASFDASDGVLAAMEFGEDEREEWLWCDWSSPDPGITFADSHSLQTTIAWQGPGVANWASNRVTLVTTYAGEYAVTNNYIVSIGILSEPVTTLEVSCPAIQFLNDGTNDYDRAERVYPVTVNLLAARGTMYCLRSWGGNFSMA